MEKKPTVRTNQISDSRKSIQSSDGKQKQHRNLRRRDLNSNFSTNNNFNARQTPINHQTHLFEPKPRTNDKRNRPRQDGHERSIGPTIAASVSRLNQYEQDDEDFVDDNFLAEQNSVYLQGSKKQNLNHLLNFNFGSRERTISGQSIHSGNGGKQNNTKRITYNKEQFLQANCQFVVNAKNDYSAYTTCPDLLVDWSCIEQVHVFGSTEEPQCPICLYHPVAAKMTRCGHVYCWPCILHYLALSDKKSWRKCPICYEAVHLEDLKSSVALPHRNYDYTEVATFQLMYREKGSLAVYKAGNQMNIDLGKSFPSFNDSIDKKMNSKLLLAEAQDIQTIIDRERNELKCQLTSDGIECPDSVFVEQALVLLEEREQQIAGNIIENRKNVTSQSEAFSLNINAKEFNPKESIEQSSTASSMNDLDSAVDQLKIESPGNFYFYQSTDGQHLYLHSINIRMLQAMYGSLDRAPHTINGKIIQKEIRSMTEEYRKRLKYLQHLPVTCHFEIAEINLDQTIVSNAILVEFKDELDNRQKRRQKRAREEHKRDKYITKLNEKQMGIYIQSTAHLDMASEIQFPTCGINEYPTISSESPSNEESSSSAASVSFAKITSDGAGSTDQFWPTLSKPKKSMEFDAATSTSSVIVSSNLEQHTDDDSVELPGEEEAFAPPAFNNSFGLAIADALNKTAYEKTNNKAKQPQTAKSKKKRNREKIVLFSSNGMQQLN